MKKLSWKVTPKAGSMKKLKLVEENITSLGPNEVRVANKAIGLNFADIFAIFGLYSATPKGEFIPGLEFCGDIIEVGTEVSDYKVGDRVMGSSRFGGYTSLLNIDQRYIIPLPDNWSYEEGAGFIVQALTAYYALIELGNAKKDQNVLIHSAAGGVGLMANRIAKKIGLFTIGSVGSSSKIDLLKKEGYDKAIVRSKNFKEDLEKSLSGKPLNIILECIGGRIFSEGYTTLAKQGRHVIYGSARYAHPGKTPNYLFLIWKYITRPKVDPQKMIEENKSIMGFNLIWLYEQVDELKNMLEKIVDLDLPAPVVGHTFKFEDMHQALELFQSGKTTGKVVVTVN
ncbi:synaptic vesicle VAT-1 family membrane protein [Marinigracilibium pacificum]|uniref:Zinc-binding dehydrogenase n=1 Tax=Marinigracilibium pacificum TaxID=2729599 RepID=A0A848J3Q5_9BACT|nr:medium chain dehydrogenase/reductase family protein [Marinigracilibium pacificum]NMM50145.1 zinc-binding dehydrogenase [Marinigracilibium pacificum]